MLQEIAGGRQPFSWAIKNAKTPAIIAGAGIFEREDKDAIFSVVESIVKSANVIRPDWNGHNALLFHAGPAAAEILV